MIIARLYILELYLIADLIVPKAVRVYFQSVSCARLRDISGVPGFCNDLVHNNLFGVDPKDSQVEGNEEHVDGSIETRISLLNEEQARLTVEARAEHQAAQAAQKRIAESNPRGLLDQSCQILDDNGTGHNCKSSGCFFSEHFFNAVH